MPFLWFIRKNLFKKEIPKVEFKQWENNEVNPTDKVKLTQEQMKAELLNIKDKLNNIINSI